MGNKYKTSVSTRSDGARVTTHSKGDGRIFERYTPSHRTIETDDGYEEQTYVGRIFKSWD